MHDKVHSNLVEARVASAQNELVMHNNAGEIADSIDNAAGLPVKYYLKYPDYFLFVNEVGSNLYCSTDKNAGVK